MRITIWLLTIEKQVSVMEAYQILPDTSILYIYLATFILLIFQANSAQYSNF